MGKIFQDLGASQQEVPSTDKFTGYKAEVPGRIGEREMLGLKNMVKYTKHLKTYGRVREYIGMKTNAASWPRGKS